MKRIVITSALLIGLFASIEAQESLWSLDDCMRYAVENSPAVKKKTFEYDTYKADRASVVASFFPTLSSSVGAQYNFGRSIDPETNTYNKMTVFSNSYNLNTQIPIFTGGQLINQWLMTRSNIRKGKNDIQKEKDDLAFKTMEAYMNVIYYGETRKLAADKLEESRRTLYKTRREEELGLKGKADVAQFEAQVAADDYILTQQENLYNTVMLTLKQLMNYPVDIELPIDTTLQKEISYLTPDENVADIFDFASINNPTALQADFQLRESRYQYRISKGQLLPTISLGAGLSTNYIDNLKSETASMAFRSQFKNNRGEYISFSLSFPLFNGLSKFTNVRRSRNNLRIAEQTKIEVFRQLQNAVDQAVLDRAGYAKEAIQMDKKVQSEALAYQVTLRKYEEGLMSPLDVQTSANTLLESRATLVQKRLNYLIKCREVDYYKGKPLISEK